MLKKNNILNFICVILTGSVLIWPSIPAAADTITIVADRWPPYNGDPDSEEPGYGIEIAQYIFDSAGHRIIYKILPWKRAVLQTRSGDYYAIIGATKNETPDFIFPEEEIGISENAFFVQKGSSWAFTGTESLLQVQVGVIKGYSYGSILDEFFKQHKEITQYVHGEDPLLLNIKKLLAKRIDVVIEDMNVFFQKAKKMGVSDRIAKAESIKDETDSRVYIAFSPEIPKSEEYAEMLTKGIRKLKTTGKLDEILTKYGLKYWK